MFAAFHAISGGRWETDYRIAAFFLLMEFVQVALFIIDPVFEWNIDWNGYAFRSLVPLGGDSGPELSRCFFVAQVPSMPGCC